MEAGFTSSITLKIQKPEISEECQGPNKDLLLQGVEDWDQCFVIPTCVVVKKLSANSNMLIVKVNFKKKQCTNSGCFFSIVLCSDPMNALPIQPKEGLSLTPKNYIEKGWFLFFTDVKIFGKNTCYKSGTEKTI